MAEPAKQFGSSCLLRLDPYQSPHEVQIGETSYRIGKRGVVVKKLLSCGIPVTVAVPARAFKGVAARAVEDAQGNVTVTLELLHHDKELSVPLLYANDMNDIAADWHSWSRLLMLPMLIVDASNTPQKVRDELGTIMIENPIERRKRITCVRHRPNFLRRRKPGVVGKVVRISADEIIARG